MPRRRRRCATAPPPGRARPCGRPGFAPATPARRSSRWRGGCDQDDHRVQPGGGAVAAADDFKQLRREGLSAAQACCMILAWLVSSIVNHHLDPPTRSPTALTGEHQGVCHQASPRAPGWTERRPSAKGVNMLELDVDDEDTGGARRGLGLGTTCERPHDGARTDGGSRRRPPPAAARERASAAFRKLTPGPPAKAIRGASWRTAECARATAPARAADGVSGLNFDASVSAGGSTGWGRQSSPRIPVSGTWRGTLRPDGVQASSSVSAAGPFWTGTCAVRGWRRRRA